MNFSFLFISLSLVCNAYFCNLFLNYRVISFFLLSFHSCLKCKKTQKSVKLGMLRGMLNSCNHQTTMSSLMSDLQNPYRLPSVQLKLPNYLHVLGFFVLFTVNIAFLMLVIYTRCVWQLHENLWAHSFLAIQVSYFCLILRFQTSLLDCSDSF